jgi:lipopolysaccharide export system permease protein
MNNNEMMTLNSTGISVARVMRPFFTAAVMLVVISLAIAQCFVPLSGRVTDRIWRQDILHERNLGTVRGGITFFRGRRAVYSFTASPAGGLPFSSFRYIAFAKEGRPQTLIYAKRAEWNDGGWLFLNGQILKRQSNDLLFARPFTKLKMALPESPAVMSIPVPAVSEINLTALISVALNAADPITKRRAIFDLNSRLSFLLLGLPLLLLALPLLLRFHRRRGGIPLAFAVPVSAGLAFCAWAAWSGLQVIVKTSPAWPLAAVWSVHLICIILGTGLYNMDYFRSGGSFSSH